MTRASGTLIISLLAVVGGVVLFRKLKGAHRPEPVGDASLDEMVEQSFPASDPPAY